MTSVPRVRGLFNRPRIWTTTVLADDIAVTVDNRRVSSRVDPFRRVQAALDAGTLTLQDLRTNPELRDIPGLADHFERVLCPVPTNPIAAISAEQIVGLFRSRRRPTPAELEAVQSGLATVARAVPTPAMAARLPQAVIFEPLREPGVFEALRQSVWRNSIGLLYHVSPDAPDKPGHTGIRVGTTIFEHVNANAPPHSLEGDDPLRAFEESYWAAPQIFEFCIDVDMEKIDALREAFLSSPAVSFDYLSRGGRDTCNHFHTRVLHDVIPELGIEPARDPMHLFASLLWHHPKMNLVVVHAKGHPPVLANEDFQFPGMEPSPLYPRRGEHPSVERLHRIAKRKPLGWPFHEG